MKKNLKVYMLMAFATVLLLAACGPAPVPDGVVVEEEPVIAVDAHGDPILDEHGDPIMVESGHPEADDGDEMGEEASDAHAPAADLPTEMEVEVLAEGDGMTPQLGDVVTVHYTLSAVGEEPFDSSYDRGQPIDMPIGIGQLLPGWEEALMDMQEGGKVKLLLPPALAFGEQGLPGTIEPNVAVESELELVAIERPEPAMEVAESDYEVTDTGLKVYDIAEGDGAEAVSGDRVMMDFSIWRDDGVIVGRSADSGGPMSFTVGSGELFEGWDEGAAGMKVGGQRQLVIPPELAFGDQGAGPAIPPGTTLIVEMALLEIVEVPKVTEVDEDDYTTTDSGLMYYDLVEGDGAVAEAGQSVTVHYTGWLEDGSVFDSSVERGQPFPFSLGTGGVIAGWDEGVAGMKVGGKRQLVIPSDLGYGDQGSPGAIPPGATLIFEVELLSVE